MPEELADAQRRIERLQQAIRELKEEAQNALAQAEAARVAPCDRGQERAPEEAAEAKQRAREVAKKQLQRARKLAEKPARQYNFTDPDSRLMKDCGLNRFAPCYNVAL